MIQIRLTPAMGKRLIGKGMVVHPAIKTVLAEGTLAIIAGSTNGYVAEEILGSLGYADAFDRIGFRRGLTVPLGAAAPAMDFPGDVVIRKGEWLKGRSIDDIVEELGDGDVVLKGGNAFDSRRQPAVQIGGIAGGTALIAVSSVIGRRVQLIVPISLEKRVFGDVYDLAMLCNAAGGQGPRLFPLPGAIFTEIEAIKLLTGADATMIAGGGVYGAEGSVWLVLSGSEEQVESAAKLVNALADEPLCEA